MQCLLTPNHWTHLQLGKAPSTPTVQNAGADISWASGLP